MNDRMPMVVMDEGEVMSKIWDTEYCTRVD